MLNESKTPRAPRARTAAGSRPPTIALDIARVAACSTWISDVLDCCSDITARSASTDVLPALTTHLGADLGDVLVPALVTIARRHLDTHATADAAPGEPGEPGDAPVWAWLTDEQLTAGLTSAYGAAQAADSLDGTIADVIAAGMDGELICWETINRESVRHEGLINKECNRLVRVIPDRAANDLKGYGWAGLRMALRNFDLGRGLAFSTYACPKINGAIRDGARAESHIPKRLTTFVRKVSSAEEKLTQELGRAPSLAEIAAFLDTTMDSMALLTRLAPAVSIEELSNPWGEKTREPACLVSAAAPEDEVVIALRNQALHAAVDALPEDERIAVRMLMLEEIPIGDAAARLGVEPRQLRMRKLRGMRALEPAMRPWMQAVPA